MHGGEKWLVSLLMGIDINTINELLIYIYTHNGHGQKGYNGKEIPGEVIPPPLLDCQPPFQTGGLCVSRQPLIIILSNCPGCARGKPTGVQFIYYTPIISLT